MALHLCFRDCTHIQPDYATITFVCLFVHFLKERERFFLFLFALQYTANIQKKTDTGSAVVWGSTGIVDMVFTMF